VAALFDINDLYVYTVRDRIFMMLRAKKIQQKEFAETINVAISTITDWKKGRSSSFLKKLPAIAEALDTTVEELLGRDRPGT